VNTATQCEFTPQYEGLQKLYDAYHDKGFEILDFPCNQFMGQAPGTAVEINSFCSLHFHTTFPRFAKIEVNGPNEIPLYAYLKSQKSGFMGVDIEWNFAKFLIDKNGEVVARFRCTEEPDVFEKDIAAQLEA
jgi:glutathione peroxidase